MGSSQDQASEAKPKDMRPITVMSGRRFLTLVRGLKRLNDLGDYLGVRR